MLAKALRALLVAELVVYALVVNALVARYRVAPSAAIAGCVVAAIVWRTGAIALTYLVARMHRAPAPPEQRLSPLRLLPYALGETLNATAVFGVLQPFPRWFVRPDGGRASAPGLPVLLVHGYVCNAGIWAVLKPALERAGASVWTIDLEPVYASVDAYVDPLARRIDEILAASGARKVLLVGHSLGGLVTRAYLSLYGGDKVGRVVTLGTPHHGSVHAALGPGANAQCMRTGSAWLAALERREGGRRAAPITSIFSYHDNFVAPQDSSLLQGARNIGLAGIGHLSLPFSPRILRLVLAEVARTNSGEPDT